MEETRQKSDALLQAEKTLTAYFDTHDVKYLAEDAVFRNMATGEVHRGRAEIGAMLHYFYHVAFEARLERTGFAFSGDRAFVEGYIKGKHIGEIAGIPATGKEVVVPVCITYHLKNALIQEAHIYLQNDVLMKQLRVSQAAAGSRTAYVVRDVFYLKYGQYRAAKKLLDEAEAKHLLPPGSQQRVLTDFTGDAYRLILEEGFDSLDGYENSLVDSLLTDGWQEWYESFKALVQKGHREILRQVK